MPDCRFGADRVPRRSRHRVTGGVGLGRVRASGSCWAGVDPASLSAVNDAAVLGPLRGGAVLTVYHCVSCSLVTGGDRRAGHARPAGLARLRDVINAWLEQTSFRAALTACAAALVLIGAAVAFALLVPGHGTAGGSGRCPARYAAIWRARQHRRPRRRPLRRSRARSRSRQPPRRRRTRPPRPRLRAPPCCDEPLPELRPRPCPAAGTGMGTAGILTAEPRSGAFPGPDRRHLPGQPVGRDRRGDQPANGPPPRCSPAPGLAGPGDIRVQQRGAAGLGG